MAHLPHVERLTPLDLLMPKVYITALLTFPTPESTPTLYQDLENGLERLSKQIPWVSGRVFQTPQTPDNKPSLEMRWDEKMIPHLINKGVIDHSYEELATSRMPAEAFSRKLLPISTMTELNPVEKGAPVFAASFFRFKEGTGVGIYISMHHNVVDATGFSEVVKVWAQKVANAQSPVLDLAAPDRIHRLFHALESDIDATSSDTLEDLFEAHPEYNPSAPAFPTEFPSCTSKLFFVPTSHIDAMKDRVRGNMVATPTTNTLLCALVWSAVTRARLERDKSLGSKSSRLAMAVNGRRRIPKLTGAENPYMGNVVVYSLAEFHGRSLGSVHEAATTESLARLCEAIMESQSATRISSRHIAEAYRLAECVEDYKTIFVGWDLFGSTDLTITSWADLDFYEMNFGTNLGKPEFVRVPYTEADGVGLVLPRKRSMNEDRDMLEVMIMLREDDMDVLEKFGI